MLTARSCVAGTAAEQSSEDEEEECARTNEDPGAVDLRCVPCDAQWRLHRELAVQGGVPADGPQRGRRTARRLGDRDSVGAQDGGRTAGWRPGPWRSRRLSECRTGRNGQEVWGRTKCEDRFPSWSVRDNGNGDGTRSSVAWQRLFVCRGDGRPAWQRLVAQAGVQLYRRCAVARRRGHDTRARDRSGLDLLGLGPCMGTGLHLAPCGSSL